MHSKNNTICPHFSLKDILLGLSLVFFRSIDQCNGFLLHRSDSTFLVRSFHPISNQNIETFQNDFSQLHAKKEKRNSNSAVEEKSGVSNKKRVQKEADQKAAQLLELCEQANRPIESIRGIVSELENSAEVLKPAQSAKIYGDWRLAFIDEEEALVEVGTGLHKLPLTRMEDLFWKFTGGRTYGRQVELIEVLRIIGPFPNVRNKLSGGYTISGVDSISVRYTEMIDGTGKQLQAGNAAMERSIELKVLYTGNKALVISTSEGRLLVLKREIDMEEELRKLRVD